MDLETAARDNRLRTTRLEDGELVIPLRGKAARDTYPSNHPHAGVWGVGTWYAMVLSSRPARTAGSALAHDTTLCAKTTDDACLVFGTPSQILSLITSGPEVFRGLTRRKLSPEHAAKLAESNKPHRFTVPSGDKVA